MDADTGSPEDPAFGRLIAIAKAEKGPVTQHMQETVELAVPMEFAFTYLDDHKRLGAHMNRSSWMMAGSRMAYELDDAKGQAVGSVMRLRGRVLGIPLEVESAVTERTVPVRKHWETRGVPKLLVIGPYRMGFELTPRGEFCSLRVFIDYLLPEGGIQRVLGLLFGRFYARWCVRSMVTDAQKRLGRARVGHQAAPP